MFWIVCYDIPDDRRRTAVMKTLEGYGRRAQYSVFECEITSDQLQRLKTGLEQIIHEQEDDVRFYPLNKTDMARIYLLGKARLQRPHPYYLV